MAPRRGRPPPELTDDVIREILLRLPPSEPAHLVRAALVCRRWRRLLADRGFLHLHRAFHGGAPPLLGFLHNRDRTDGVPRFIPSSLGAAAAAETAACRFSLPEPEPHAWLALDARHGRVLLHSSDPKRLVVWDPITGDHHKLPLPAHPYRSLAAAVLCAAMDGCDHLDCHGGPFLVAFAATTRRRSSDNSEMTWVSVFSSTDGAWGAPTSLSIPLGPASHVATTPGLLADGAIHFTLRRGDDGVGILKYDILRRSLSVIDPPFLRHDVVSMSMFPIPPYRLVRSVVLIATAAEEDSDGGGGNLGVAAVECVRDSPSALQRHFLHLWACRAVDDDGGGVPGWVQRRVIDLDALLPAAVPKKCAFAVKRVSGFAEGADTIFVSTNVGTYAVELKSFRTVKLTKIGFTNVVPFVSFLPPVLAHLDEGAGQTSGGPHRTPAADTSPEVPNHVEVKGAKNNFVHRVKKLAASMATCARLNK